MKTNYKLNNDVVHQITGMDLYPKYTCAFAYVANQTSDAAEVDELVIHLQNIKYYLHTATNAKSALFVYNGYEIIVHKFSLIQDSMSLYLKEKYYQISNKQFYRYVAMYNELYEVKKANAEVVVVDELPETPEKIAFKSVLKKKFLLNNVKYMRNVTILCGFLYFCLAVIVSYEYSTGVIVKDLITGFVLIGIYLVIFLAAFIRYYHFKDKLNEIT